MKKVLLFAFTLIAISSFAQVFPFTDDFESYTNFSSLGTQGGYKSDMSVYQTHGMGNSSKGLVSQISQFNTRDTTVSPLIGQVGAAAQMSFYYRILNQSLYPSTPTVIGNGDVIEVYAGIEAIGAYQLMYTINSTNHVADTAFKKVKINIPGTFVGQTGNFKFVIKKGTATDYWVDIDSLKFADTIAATPPTVNATSAMGFCHGDCAGAVGAHATGGTGTLTYVWSSGLGTTASVTNVCAGTYTVTVTDAASATASASVQVTEPPLLITNPTSSNVSCYGLADGCIDLNSSGGTPTYDYIWSGGASGDSTCGLAAGNYDVTVLDLNNCTATASFVLTAPDSMTVSYTHTDPTVFNATNGTINVTATGGTGTKTFSLDGGSFQASSSFPNLAAGCYTISVKDANGCIHGPGTVCLFNQSSFSNFIVRSV